MVDDPGSLGGNAIEPRRAHTTKMFHEAAEAAQRADAVVYTILVVPITNDAGRNTGGENALDSTLKMAL